MDDINAAPTRGALYALARPNSVLFPPRPAAVAMDGLWVLTQKRRHVTLAPASEARTGKVLCVPSVLLLHFDLRDDELIGEPAALALVALSATFRAELLYSNAALELTPRFAGTNYATDGQAWLLSGLAAHPVIAELIPVDAGLVDWRTAVDTHEADRRERTERIRRTEEREAVADAAASRLTDFARTHGFETATAVRTNGAEVRVVPEVLTYLLDNVRPAA